MKSESETTADYQKLENFEHACDISGLPSTELPILFCTRARMAINMLYGTYIRKYYVL